MVYRLHVSYSSTMKPMLFDLPELNDALLRAKVVRERGFQVDRLEFNDGSELGPAAIWKLVQERRALLEGWRRLY